MGFYAWLGDWLPVESATGGVGFGFYCFGLLVLLLGLLFLLPG